MKPKALKGPRSRRIPSRADVEANALLRPKRIDPSQAWFWTPEWQKAEREADADIKAGRVKSFSSVEDLIAELDR